MARPRNKLKLNFRLLIPLTALLILSLLLLLFFSKNFLLNQTLKKSTASFSIQGSNLKIDFDIVDTDSEKARKFSKSLGVEESLKDGIKVELDKASLEWLEERIPKKVYLGFSGDSISFNSGPVYVLNNALPQEKINFSTGSAKLNLARKRNGDFSLNLKKPQDLFFYATSSGKLMVSEKDLLFPILNKIDTIEITLKEKSLKGKISLRD